MVWELSSVGSELSSAGGDDGDAGTYYFISPGTYMVGRKGCPIVISSDKTVSRSHAEIVFSPGPDSCQASVRDTSKFGTYVNGSRIKESSATIRDGDIITFGTAGSSFRINYLRFYLCVPGSRIGEASKLGSTIGARCVQNWEDECTHLLVDEESLVTEAVLRAAGHKVPIVSIRWLEAMASCSSPITKLPGIASYLPTLKLQVGGFCASVKVVEPKNRELTLIDVALYTTTGKYVFNQEGLHSLVKAAGGSISSNRLPEENRRFKSEAILVPQGICEPPAEFSQLRRINEANLVLSLLGGLNDPSLYYLPETSASKSQSSDATVDLQVVEEEEDDANSLAPLEEAPSERPPGVQVQGWSGSTRCERDDPPAFGEIKFADVVLAQAPSSSQNFKSFKRVGALSGNTFSFLVPFDPVPYSSGANAEEFTKEERKRIADRSRSDELFKDDLPRAKRAKTGGRK